MYELLTMPWEGWLGLAFLVIGGIAFFSPDPKRKRDPKNPEWWEI